MTSGTSENLKSIWGVTQKDIFIVGLDGTILHYDGSVWSAMDSGVTYSFYDIWGSSANNIFAVGNRYQYYDGITNATETLATILAPLFFLFIILSKLLCLSNKTNSDRMYSTDTLL